MMSLPFILHLEEFSKARDGKISAMSFIFECYDTLNFFNLCFMKHRCQPHLIFRKLWTKLEPHL